MSLISANEKRVTQNITLIENWAILSPCILATLPKIVELMFVTGSPQNWLFSRLNTSAMSCRVMSLPATGMVKYFCSDRSMFQLGNQVN